MTTHLVVLHGIGAQRAGWSNSFEDGVRKWLGEEESLGLTWSEVNYADLNGTSALQLWYKIRTLVNDTFLRRFVLTHLSDALDMDSYQERVFRRLETALLEVTEGDRVILVSHSLGTVLAARWLRLTSRKVYGIVTLGSPLPLFAERAEIIRQLNAERWWFNCYDPTDPIGCPLLPLGYPVHEDVSVRNKGRSIPFVRHLNAHVNYDRNPVVQQLVAKMVANAEALPP